MVVLGVSQKIKQVFFYSNINWAINKWDQGTMSPEQEDFP